MNTRLREAWKSLVKAEDYEAHMADAGQAQANANLSHRVLSSAANGARRAALVRRRRNRADV
jgi:hypothetical protein